MKVIQILEANVGAKIKDPKIVKMLTIAMRHDSTLPKDKIAALGSAAFGQETDPKKQAENSEKVLKLWSDLLDDSLRSTDYGDLSQDGKFDEWLTRLYTNGVVDYEDINGEGGDALGAWKALSIRGKLKEPHQDFNRFKNLRQIQSIVQSREYRDELQKIKDAEVIEKHKREKKEITIIDDERFLVVVPFNYGSCYTFNNSAGFQASFCTGSSSGARWFERYAPDGPIISVIDKDNVDDVNGKWQIHAPTNQINNGNQTIRRDDKFAELFPGLMKKIVAGIQAKSDEIKKASQEIAKGGYDIAGAISDLKSKFPISYASGEEEKKDEPEQNANDGPGVYLVTQLASGKTARIEGESRQDIINKLTTRYPDSTEADYTIEKQE
jgi:hypothetical protein